MTLLYEAAAQIEQLTLDRDLTHLRNQLSPVIAEMVYYGYWYSAKFDALTAFIRKSHEVVTGEATLRLYKGNVIAVKRSSPNSLYDEALPPWKQVGLTIKTMQKGLFESKVCRIECKASIASSAYNLLVADAASVGADAGSICHGRRRRRCWQQVSAQTLAASATAGNSPIVF